MSQKSNIIVKYDKFYVDDVGKNIPDLLAGIDYDDLSITSYWEGTIDAFFKCDCDFYFTCIHGDLRIITANEQGSNNYKFGQYFISGLDGKIIKVPAETWFGTHNLGTGQAINLVAKVGDFDGFDKLTSKIFNWYSKK